MVMVLDAHTDPAGPGGDSLRGLGDRQAGGRRGRRARGWGAGKNPEAISPRGRRAGGERRPRGWGTDNTQAAIRPRRSRQGRVRTAATRPRALVEQDNGREGR